MSAVGGVPDTASSSSSTIEMLSSDEFHHAHRKQINNSSSEESPCYYNYTFQTGELVQFLRVVDETFRSLKPFFSKHCVVLASEPLLNSKYIKEQGLAFCARSKKDLMVALQELQNYGVSSKPFAFWSPVNSPTKSPTFFSSGSVPDNPQGGILRHTKREESSKAKEVEASLQPEPPQKCNTQSFFVQIDGSPTLQLTNRERSKTITIVPKLPEKIGVGWQLVAKPRAISSPAKLPSGLPKKDVHFSKEIEIATVAQGNNVESYTIEVGHLITYSSSKSLNLCQESVQNTAEFMEDGNEISTSEKPVYKVPQRRLETGLKKVPKLRVETTMSPVNTIPKIKKCEIPKEIADATMNKTQSQGDIESRMYQACSWDTYPQQHSLSGNLSGGYPSATLPPNHSAIIWQDLLPPDNFSWPPAFSHSTSSNGRPGFSSEYPRFERTRPQVPEFPYTISPRRYPATPSYLPVSPKRFYFNRGQQIRNQVPRFSFDENQHPSFHKNQPTRPFEQTRSNLNRNYQSIRVNENFQPGEQTQRVRTSRPRIPKDTQEDDELSLENGMPYRLRPPPLTGPKIIR